MTRAMMKSVSVWSIGAAAIGCALVAGCAAGMSSGSWKLNAAETIPAAEGSVSLAEANNGNTRMAVRVRHLAVPDKVSPGAASYVVWVTPQQDPKTPMNVGALRVDKDLDGQLDTITPLRSFEVTVTAEPDPTATEPTGDVLMSTKVDRN